MSQTALYHVHGGSVYRSQQEDRKVLWPVHIVLIRNDQI